MVGEMREPGETMRLTLNASETGHLVLTTMRSSTCAEALARVVSRFRRRCRTRCARNWPIVSSRSYANVCAEPDLKIQYRDEIMVNTMAVKNFIRMGGLLQIISAMEMGAESRMWTLPDIKTCSKSKA